MAGPILPHGHDLNKHDTGLLGDATYLISRLSPCDFRQCFPLS